MNKIITNNMGCFPSTIFLWIIVVCSLIFGNCQMAIAQDANGSTEQLIADIFEQYSAESETNIDYESFYEDLMYCAQNPINLNTATQEQLYKLPFLSSIQIENILAYVYENGSLKSIYELQLIDGLDMTDIRRMLPFVQLGDILTENKPLKIKDMVQYGKNSFYCLFSKGLENKEGYQTDDDSETSAYLGNDWYHSLRYRYQFKERVQCGLTAEKDAAEPFWTKYHKGYDFYSFYSQINDIGKFKTVVVGDYKANFGQGLVIHQDFMMGKSSYVMNVVSLESGLKRSTSTNEYNFLRGVGTTINVGKFTGSIFSSYRKLDADTTGGFFSSIYKTGYHRTTDEMEKKRTLSQTVFGANIDYRGSWFLMGITVVNMHLALPLLLEKKPYNFFYFSGKSQTTTGIHYRFRVNKLNFYGETAMTDYPALATINVCTFNPTSLVSLVGLHRYYSPCYDAFFANGFGANSRVNNENGIYLGAEVSPMRKVKISVYADSYHFEWFRYGVDAPSSGTDYLFQTDYIPQSKMTMYWRLRYKKTENNISSNNETMASIAEKQKLSLRYQFNYTHNNITVQNTIEGNRIKMTSNKTTYGIIACQDLSYKFTRIPLQLDVRYQFFDASDYDNAFYSYEKDILYAFAIPMFYGKGTRYYLNIRYDVNKKISLWFKIAQTIYADDRTSVSSGNETISGNRKTDIKFMINCEL